jgi:hypothetical protein
MITVDFGTGRITVSRNEQPGVVIVRQGPQGPGGDGVHGHLLDLDQDDHPQYMTAERAQTWGDSRYARVTIAAERPASPEAGEIWVPDS